MRKSFISVTLITACLTFQALSHFVPEHAVARAMSPVKQPVFNTPAQLETIHVSAPKLMLQPTVNAKSKPHAKLAGKKLNLALRPEVIVLPRSERERVSPLLLVKR